MVPPTLELVECMTGVMPHFQEVEPLFDLQADEPVDAIESLDAALQAELQFVPTAKPADALLDADTDFDSEAADPDADWDVGFVAPAQLKPATMPHGRWWIVGAWGLSLLIHAAVVVAAGTIWLQFKTDGTGKSHTPPRFQFALGDTAEDLGVRNRNGADLPPGIQGLDGSAISNGTPEPSSEAEAVPETPSTPPPAFETDLITESGMRPIVPPAELNRKLQELPGFRPAKLNLPAAESPPDPSAHAGAQQASATVSNANASAANPSPLESINGQSGATTGEGGSATSGLPGIRAGVRSGRNLIKPQYPLACREAGEQGTVRLQVDVRADGTIAKVRVLDDAGFPRLAQAALRSLDGFRFDPALDQSGNPVADTICIPYEFGLKRPRK
jgi:protein TonB